MSVARKTLLVILTLVLGVPTVAFVTAKIVNRHNKEQTPAAPSVAAKTNAEKPLFYDSVGSSDPEAAVTKGAGRVIRYTVSVKTVGTREEAEKILRDLTNAGLMGYYTPVRQKDHVAYHVRLGVYQDEREAAKTLATLQTKAKITGSVTQLQ